MQKTIEKTDSLTIEEKRTKLADLERMFEARVKIFLKSGGILKEIRDSGLYKINYPTFEIYCKERWNFSRQTAYNYIDAFDVIENLKSQNEMSTIVDKIYISLPNNEAQIRELKKLPPDQQAEVWQETCKETNGSPTARAVKEKVEEKLNSSPGQFEEITELNGFKLGQTFSGENKTAEIIAIDPEHQFGTEKHKTPFRLDIRNSKGFNVAISWVSEEELKNKDFFLSPEQKNNLKDIPPELRSELAKVQENCPALSFDEAWETAKLNIDRANLRAEQRKKQRDIEFAGLQDYEEPDVVEPEIVDDISKLPQFIAVWNRLAGQLIDIAADQVGDQKPFSFRVELFNTNELPLFNQTFKVKL